MSIKVFEQSPPGFAPQVYVAAAYVLVGGRLLLLQLAQHKQEASRWGVPAGKLEENELPEDGLKRELFEETGIRVEESTNIAPVGKLFVRKPTVDYIYHAYKIRLKTEPQVTLSYEHVAYKWVSFKEAEQLPLMDGAKEALAFALKGQPSKFQ